MVEKQLITKDPSKPKREHPLLRLGCIVGRSFVAIVGGMVKGAFYCAWYLAFYVLCIFRPFPGMMVLAAVVTVPMAIVVFANNGAANGMPFWAFVLRAIGFVAFADGYTLFVDWVARPGAEDPFARCGRHDR